MVSSRRNTSRKAKITVTVRKRPLTESEVSRKELDILRVPDKKSIRVEEPRYADLSPVIRSSDFRKSMQGENYVENHSFNFDRVYDENCTNQEVYSSCVKTLVDSVFEYGGRCSCFAYGQTGSGKTYTMVGPYPSRITQREVPAEHRGKYYPAISQKERAGLWEWAAQDICSWLKRSKYRDFSELWNTLAMIPGSSALLVFRDILQ